MTRFLRFPLFWLPLLLWAANGCPTTADDDDDTTAGESTLLGLGLAPNDPILTPGEAVQFEAKAFYDDYTNVDVTGDVAWVSTDDRVAEISGLGVASALEPGETEIIATYEGGVSAKVTLTVSGSEVTGVELTPSQLELHAGDTAQISAIAHFADGTSGNIAGSCAWSTEDAGVAGVDGTGEVSAVAVGQTLIHAAYEEFPIAPVAVTVLDDDVPLPEPDLRISNLDATVSGDEITYTVTVVNDGDGYASEFYVNLYLDLPGTPDVSDPYDGWTYLPGLGAGDSTQAMADVGPVAAGTYQSWAYVDPDEWVEESSEGNNTAGPETVVIEPETPQDPDLTITLFDGVTDGSYTLYEIRVENVGGSASGSFYLDLFYDSIYQPTFGDYGDDYTTVPSLAPGGSFVWEPDVEAGPAIVWDSWLLVDTDDSVVEVDEGDNIGYLELWP